MQLEQIFGYQPKIMQKQQTYFVVGDLESFSASVLYSDCPEYDKHVRETIREDNHSPFGEHLNYELWMNLNGQKEGRSKLINNLHIPLNSGS